MRPNTAFRAAPGGANATTRAARARDAPTEGATAADDAAPTDGATGAAPVDSAAAPTEGATAAPTAGAHTRAPEKTRKSDAGRTRER